MNLPDDPPRQAARAMRLLRTKLFIPRTHPGMIPRPALAHKLTEGLQRKLTIISAPAGSGKTSLLSDWIHTVQTSAQLNVRANFAWVSLDEHDNDPTRFWSYTIAALQTLQPDIGKTAQDMLQSQQPPPTETILTELLNEIDLLPFDFALVLDDYHSVDTRPIHEGLAFLLENLPPRMHLMIAGRTEPPLPLPTFRVRRDLIELHAEDLRFTKQEAASFLNQVMGLSLSAEEIDALDHLTEGWVAGLQLAALSMQGIEDVSGFIRSFSGSHRYIFDYLAQEVLNRQPPEIQAFLLQTSVLERLCSDLCEAILDNKGKGIGDKGTLSPIPYSPSQEILEFLERSNLFLVPLDQERRWYRYHHLFAEFLQTRLEQQAGREAIARLRRSASQWFEQRGYISEAISLALAAEDYDQAVSLVKAATEEMFLRSQLHTLVRWVQAIPDYSLRADPVLSMSYCWALLATGQTADIEPHLQGVEHILGTAADGSEYSLSQSADIQGALGEITCIRASLAFNQMDFHRVVFLSKQAQTYLNQSNGISLFTERTDLMGIASFNLAVAFEMMGDLTAAKEEFSRCIPLIQNNLHLLPLAISHLAQLHWVGGQLRQAEQTYLQAQQVVGKAGTFSPMAGTIYTGLGNILYEKNKPEQAVDHFNRGIEMGRQWTMWEVLVSGYAGLLRVKMAQDQFDEACSLLEELNQYVNRFQIAWGPPTIEMLKALVSANMGDLEDAARWAASSGIPLDREINYFLEGQAIILARVLIKLRKLEPAGRLVSSLLAGAEAGQRWGRVIEILILQALIQSDQRKWEDALEALHRALTLAEPEGYIRIFLDEGEPVKALLKDIQLNAKGPLAAYIRELLAAFPDGDQAAPIPSKIESPKPALQKPSDMLSSRELEVLRLIADGLTNQEIAERLVVSLNTVKTHVKNIFSRLEVSSRTQATAKARELGLL